MIDRNERSELLKIARDSLESAFSGNAVIIPHTDIRRGAFVTLRKNGELRGCIGYLEGIEPLYNEIFSLSRSAAFEDYRFLPLKEEELPLISIEISIMTEPRLIKGLDEFELIRDGIILKAQGRKAVFLPQVAEETGWTKEQMLSALSRKAGLSSDAWKDDGSEFWTFQAEVFSEDDL